MPNFENQMHKDLSKQVIQEYPFEHVLVDDFLASTQLIGLQSDLKKLENSAPQKIFESAFGTKQEWKIFPDNLNELKGFIDYMSSEKLISQIKSLFSIGKETNIYPDLSYDGGGYVISPPQSFLSYHADFNFSNEIKKFRSLNILFYMNPESTINGGSLHLLDAESKTVEKIVEPKLNRLLIFKTDDVSFHGVSRNNENFFRRSFNFYYYTDVPLSQKQSQDPHKTIWMDFNHGANHTH
jgi:hypothetical protein